jgi:septal ring factor EnvC (AmiA/AmiB activator)
LIYIEANVYGKVLLEKDGMDSEILRLLESRIEGVLSQRAELSQERDRLRDELGQARAQIEHLAGQLREHEREKAQVKARVERIMSRLEGLNLD